MKKAALIILDGWGIGKCDDSDGIHLANTPVFDGLMQSSPNNQLLTHGENVGLPAGQMGNSEVGHLNIGAGRVVYQELVRINRAIESGELASHPNLAESLEKAKTKNKLHLIGLVSDGGVHSHIDHLIALCGIAHISGIENIYIHAFTDGRDCDPHSGKGFLEHLSKQTKSYNAKIVSVIGRYYAMDRDLRWERVAKAYNLIVKGEGKQFDSVEDVFAYSYDNNITDEFIEPSFLGNQNTTIQDDDAVICFNFRTDRCREITRALTQEDFPEHGMKALSLDYTTMTRYDDFKNVRVIFEKENIKMTLGEFIAENNLSQLRIAETEKYPHVTFFFNGGREEPYKNERRIMINSPKVATYDLQPEMSAPEITSAVIEDIQNNTPDFICLNFANTDMVGHTGVPSAIIKAAETVDGCLGEIIEVAKSHEYNMIIIADHGNADYMKNDDGSPNTAHSLNPVPCIVISNKPTELNNGVLADVAPTILELMGLRQPSEMTGKSLIKK